MNTAIMPQGGGSVIVSQEAEAEAEPDSDPVVVEVKLPVAVPFKDPKHNAGVEDNVNFKLSGSVIVIEFVPTQVLLSVTVTVYVPADKFEIKFVVSPPGAHE